MANRQSGRPATPNPRPGTRDPGPLEWKPDTPRSGKSWWIILRGAWKYRRCREQGPERATEAEAWARIGHCAGCTTRVTMRSLLLKMVLRVVFDRPLYFTCGAEGEEVKGERCGCLTCAERPRGSGPPPDGIRPVAVLVKGRPVDVEPAGKAWCARERCPQGKW